MDWLVDYWWAVALAALVAIVLLYLLLRPRQTVRLGDAAPIRAHMIQESGRGLVDEAAQAVEDVAQPIVNSPIHTSIPQSTGAPDDLTLLKGVGPKLADLLNAHGIFRFDQIANLGAGQLETLDQMMGAFRGRLSRDRIVEQADYLARGDREGFEGKFGKL